MSQEKAISILASKLSFHMYTHIYGERKSHTLCNFVRITHFISHYFVINLTLETL